MENSLSHFSWFFPHAVLLSKIVLWLFIAFLGASFGSFLGVILIRKHQAGKNFDIQKLNGRSKCDGCGKTIKWYHNIPLLSYLFLRGKCAYCKQKISPLVFIIELSLAFDFLFVFGYFFWDFLTLTNLENGIFPTISLNQWLLLVGVLIFVFAVEIWSYSRLIEQFYKKTPTIS